MDGQPATIGTNEDQATAGSSAGRLEETQAQVQEVVGIMRVNVEKVLERDAKLTELDARADVLQAGASQFEQQATRLKRKQWYANLKWTIIAGACGVLLIVIIVWALWPEGQNNGGDGN